MECTNKTLFLLDGSSFLYRAYYGLKPLHTKDGKPVQAVYGFCRMIKKLIDQWDPRYMVLVWDSKGPTERHEEFAAYKATRQEPPSDLFEQKEYIVEFANMIGLYQLAQPGVEADDLMYSLAQLWQKEGSSVVIVTSDKDMGQAITSDIVLYDAFKEQVVDTQAFQEKMGFAPSKTVFYFSLLGDASDNIPGVKGVGKKGALELLHAFNSLQDVYEHLDQVASNRIRNALKKYKKEAFLSEKLFTLRSHPIIYTESELSFDKDRWVEARSFFEKLEFFSLVHSLARSTAKKIQERKVKTSQEKGYSFICVTTQKQLQKLVSLIREKKLFAYDTEGVGTSAMDLDMVGLSVCVQEGESFYIPCGHTQGEQLSRADVVTALKPVFEDISIKKIAHHAKFDQIVLHNHGIQERGLIFDTIIAASLVKQEWQKSALKELSYYYLQEPMATFKQVVQEFGYKNFAEVPLDQATEYAAADAHQTFKLYPVLQQLLKDQDFIELYYSVEMPLLPVLVGMELQGIYCDVRVLQELDVVVTRELEKIQKTAVALLDPVFEMINFNSSQQVATLLFDHLQLPPQRKNEKGGGYSTDNEVLRQLAHMHPLPSFIIQYRELYKLKSTYIDALPTYINKKTGRIHTNYSQTRVATGRLASSDPNMQNIPVEGIGSTVRMAFKPQHANRVFISADYSQIELRILAHLSQDPQLLKAFEQNHDIHAQTAAGIFSVPFEQVTMHQRSVGKRINFSILYGLTPYGLSKDLQIPVKDAKQYIDAYFDQYPKVKIWMHGVIEQAKKDGYVTTVFGRRRAIPGLQERNKHLYDMACRIAVNTVVQGTSAEIMKMGMIRVDTLLRKQYKDTYLLLQIHDEIVISVPQDITEIVKNQVQKELESIVDWDVVLRVSVHHGNNWKEVK